MTREQKYRADRNARRAFMLILTWLALHLWLVAAIRDALAAAMW